MYDNYSEITTCSKLVTLDNIYNGGIFCEEHAEMSKLASLIRGKNIYMYG